MKFPRLSVFLALFTISLARAADPVTDTIVECTGLFETISTDKEIISTFRDNVVVTGNNLKLTCDFLTVIALRKDSGTAALGKYGYFKSLVATGHVRIVQGDREAGCGRAEIFPGEDKIILSEKVDGQRPHVRSLDDGYKAEGYRLVLYRGQRRAVIEPDPDSTERTRLTLPVIKDLGFDKDAPPAGPDLPKVEAAK